jgi:type IV secretory pathway component VirB8
VSPTPALQLVRISTFVDLPQQSSSLTCVDALRARNICHLQRADDWIVLVIVLVIIIIIIIIIIITIIVTVMTIHCAVSSVT